MFMYKNVGKKIQTLAKIVAWIGIICFIVIGAVVLYGGLNTNDFQMIAGGIFLMIICPILCWLGSLTAVGFGKLVETNEQTNNKIENLIDIVKELKKQ